MTQFLRLPCSENTYDTVGPTAPDDAMCDHIAMETNPAYGVCTRKQWSFEQRTVWACCVLYWNWHETYPVALLHHIVSICSFMQVLLMWNQSTIKLHTLYVIVHSACGLYVLYNYNNEMIINTSHWRALADYLLQLSMLEAGWSGLTE